ncbi:MAG: hypothetical protein ACLPTZ_26405 [Beijerinckiaceae bacterium]
MNRAWTLALSVCLACPVLAQSSTAGPLGVLVHPAQEIKPPDEVQKAIPANVVVRWMQQTHLSSEGEISLIYDTGDEFEPKAHFAFVRDGIRMGDFRLAEALLNPGESLDDFVDSHALFQAAEIPLQTGRKGLLAAFRNIGDGSATIFALITQKDGKYSFAWSDWTTQAQFRIGPKGAFQVWNSDDGDNCVWCTHHYEVANYVWKNDTLVKLSHYATKHALSPYQFSENPIVVKH